ncbi:unnamed protein product [Protopolystoma xenopodis]|uniref:Amino acid transporter n=1 Tax=Protopolystoma xenopodis TaxID=117903 RepID=A0A448X333_9PLAT|nr:unnamed protein product [Protopolystoma xenopodis]
MGITVLLSYSVFMLLVADLMPPTSDFVPLIAGICTNDLVLRSGQSMMLPIFVGLVGLAIAQSSPSGRSGLAQYEDIHPHFTAARRSIRNRMTL